MLKLGATGRAVTILNSRLAIYPAATKTVGWLYNEATESKVKSFQQDNNLNADGIYGPITNAALVSYKPSDVNKSATQNGIDVNAFKAIIAVETNGKGFYDDGRPVILLERHYVYRLATPAQRNTLNSDVCYPTAGGYVGGLAEWDRFEVVASVSLLLAIMACSWGLAQIMGANYKLLDCATPAHFYNQVCDNEIVQLQLLARFIVNNNALKNALNAKEWETVARIYNGPNFASNNYAVKLAKAYKNVA